MFPVELNDDNQVVELSQRMIPYIEEYTLFELSEEERKALAITSERHLYSIIKNVGFSLLGDDKKTRRSTF